MVNAIAVFRLLTDPRQTPSQEDTMKLHKRFLCSIEVEEDHIQK